MQAHFTGIAMPVLASSYVAPWYARNGHANTMWPVIFRKRPAISPSMRRVRIDNIKIGALKPGQWRNLTEQELRGLLPQQQQW